MKEILESERPTARASTPSIDSDTLPPLRTMKKRVGLVDALACVSEPERSSPRFGRSNPLSHRYIPTTTITTVTTILRTELPNLHGGGTRTSMGSEKGTGTI